MASKKKTDTYYHYTDPESRDNIIREGAIRESSQGVAGSGVYLTKVPPQERKGKIAENNYDGYRDTHAESMYQQGKVDAYIKVELPKSEVQKVSTSRDVYIHRGDLPLNKTAKTGNVGPTK